MKRYTTVLVWLRRDLRLHDHAALHAACLQAERVIPVFVFDTNILRGLPADDRRVTFIYSSLQDLQRELLAQGSSLLVGHGKPEVCLPQLARQWQAEAVFCNRDHEPAAVWRDHRVAGQLRAIGCKLLDFRDQVIFERDDVLTGQGTPFRVFTPYSRAWLTRLAGEPPESLPVNRSSLARLLPQPLPALSSLGFRMATLPDGVSPGSTGGQLAWRNFQARLAGYATERDFPARHATSGLSVHLRFGTVSIRELVRHAWLQPDDGAQKWLLELIWREFYQQLLWHHPEFAEGRAFRPETENIRWPNPPGHFEAWTEGRTGYPLVDAAMRELRDSGTMHNRLRMITASFLVKDLHVDWRQGEAWFARHLLDFDLAANNGGWQWSASTGCDAQPWFRIFNPVSQSERYDPDGDYIRRHVSELAQYHGKDIHSPWLRGGVPGYPAPLVDHARSRATTLDLFRKVSGGAAS